jgi:hypothetical protein
MRPHSSPGSRNRRDAVFPHCVWQPVRRAHPLVVARLAGLLALITIGAALVLYLFTRNRRYLAFAWRVFQFAVVFLMLLMALYVLERLVLVA